MLDSCCLVYLLIVLSILVIFIQSIFCWLCKRKQFGVACFRHLTAPFFYLLATNLVHFLVHFLLIIKHPQFGPACFCHCHLSASVFHSNWWLSLMLGHTQWTSSIVRIVYPSEYNGENCIWEPPKFGNHVQVHTWCTYLVHASGTQGE